MADNKSEEEPSIEEILSSIRQIISDDEEDDNADDVEESIVESPIHEDSDDVLELTEQDLVEDEPEEEPAMPDEPPIEIDMRDREEAFADEQIEDEPEAEAAPEPEAEDFEEDIEEDIEDDLEEDLEEEYDMDQEDPRNIIEEIRAQTAERANTVPSDILSNAAQSAALGSINKLKSKMPINNARSYDGVTLEDIVREMLHPMLREWMDDNLPPMVERIVQKELEKLARRAFDD